jgi:hypothetical protein
MMDQEELNMQVRKLLKQFGVTSQQQLEQAISAALASGALKGDERLSVRMSLQVAELGLEHTIGGEIDLGR